MNKIKIPQLDKLNICIVGLGYVGLPLAIEFGKKYKTIGFDVNQTRIDELKSGYDKTLEVEKSNFDDSKLLIFSSDDNNINDCNIYIITVPTPIDKKNNFGNCKTLIVKNGITLVVCGTGGEVYDEESVDLSNVNDCSLEYFSPTLGVSTLDITKDKLDLVFYDVKGNKEYSYTIT